VILTVLALLTSLALAYRVLINVPGSNSIVDRKAGGFVGLLATIAIFYGGYASMREEGLPERDARTEIETVRLRNSAGSGEPAPHA
jgi:succinate-acetate transporter protein